jgi:thiamine monophosphate kinase
VTGEFAAIDRLMAQLPALPADAAALGEVWIGDDAAVVRTPAAPWLLLAADAVVAGVHADLRLTTLQDLGWKALVSNLSDLAAMGGSPGHALVVVAGPSDTDLDALYEGLAEGRAASDAGATAMIDVSDGLAAELAHLADASGIGFELDVVPVAAGATSEEALGGGEDYELVFCAPDPSRVTEAFASLRPPVRIGRCVGPSEHRQLLGRTLESRGWQHDW